MCKIIRTFYYYGTWSFGKSRKKSWFLAIFGVLFGGHFWAFFWWFLFTIILIHFYYYFIFILYLFIFFIENKHYVIFKTCRKVPNFGRGGVRGTFFNILKNEKKPCRNRVATFFGPPFWKGSKTPCLFDGG